MPIPQLNTGSVTITIPQDQVETVLAVFQGIIDQLGGSQEPAMEPNAREDEINAMTQDLIGMENARS
jgi:hypothetical protein